MLPRIGGGRERQVTWWGGGGGSTLSPTAAAAASVARPMIKSQMGPTRKLPQLQQAEVGREIMTQSKLRA